LPNITILFFWRAVFWQVQSNRKNCNIAEAIVLYRQQYCKRSTDLIVLNIRIEGIKRIQVCFLKSRIAIILIDRIGYTRIVVQPQKIRAV
jgi:hypothetical protein